MASKKLMRSIRISDDMAELINRQTGNNFTEKWENLVTRCVWELPQKEAQLQQIQERIDRELLRLHNLQRATEQLRLLESDLTATRRYFQIVERRAKTIADAAEKD